MARMMLSPDRLSALLKPQGFWLRDANSLTKEIAFVRTSETAPLYEHLNVHGQGKIGEAVYATTSVSGSTNHSDDDCVSERDLSLMYLLETDKDRHWTLVHTREEAKRWEISLAQHADAQCLATVRAKGPTLRATLAPAFDALTRYISAVGNIYKVFDSEFKYFSDAPAEQRAEAEELAWRVGNIGESSEDIELACLFLFLFSSDVEGRRNVFRGRKWEEDGSLRVRVYLLVDFIREQRKLYLASRG
jgi:hypothetical protein